MWLLYVGGISTASLHIICLKCRLFNASYFLCLFESVAEENTNLGDCPFLGTNPTSLGAGVAKSIGFRMALMRTLLTFPVKVPAWYYTIKKGERVFLSRFAVC